jgi:hypothetical protein
MPPLPWWRRTPMARRTIAFLGDRVAFKFARDGPERITRRGGEADHLGSSEEMTMTLLPSAARR